MTSPAYSRPAVFALIAVLLAFGLGEAGLRISGFSYQAGPVYMQFGYPNQQTLSRIFQRDPILFWNLIPNSTYLPDHIHINSKGFRGPEFRIEKPRGTIRIIALGDSCTFLGERSYPERLEEKLRKAFPGRSLEVINMAVPGYSSFQGLRLLERQAIMLRPDLVTVFFGWNDHWPSRGTKDRNQKAPGLRVAALQKVLGHLCIYQVIHWLVHEIQPHEKQENRVPIPDYKENLRQIVRLARGRKAEVILITAPTAAQKGAGLAPYLLAEGIIQDADSALAMHQEYNEAVRELANETKAALVDAASIFQDNPDPGFFWKDNMHLSEAGLEWLSGLIAHQIQVEELINTDFAVEE